MSGTTESIRHYNYTIPAPGEARAVAIADTTVHDIDLDWAFPGTTEGVGAWNDGKMFSIRCSQNFRAQLNDTATATIVETTTAPDGTLDDTEAFLYSADTEYRFVAPKGRKYLHVKAAAAGTFWIAVTSCVRTG